jgi:competence protein ComGC
MSTVDYSNIAAGHNNLTQSNDFNVNKHLDNSSRDNIENNSLFLENHQPEPTINTTQQPQDDSPQSNLNQYQSQLSSAATREKSKQNSLSLLEMQIINRDRENPRQTKSNDAVIDIDLPEFDENNGAIVVHSLDGNTIHAGDPAAYPSDTPRPNSPVKITSVAELQLQLKNRIRAAQFFSVCCIILSFLLLGFAGKSLEFRNYEQYVCWGTLVGSILLVAVQIACFIYLPKTVIKHYNYLQVSLAPLLLILLSVAIIAQTKPNSDYFIANNAQNVNTAAQTSIQRLIPLLFTLIGLLIVQFLIIFNIRNAINLHNLITNSEIAERKATEQRIYNRKRQVQQYQAKKERRKTKKQSKYAANEDSIERNSEEKQALSPSAGNQANHRKEGAFSALESAVPTEILAPPALKSPKHRRKQLSSGSTPKSAKSRHIALLNPAENNNFQANVQARKNIRLVSAKSAIDKLEIPSPSGGGSTQSKKVAKKSKKKHKKAQSHGGSLVSAAAPEFILARSNAAHERKTSNNNINKINHFNSVNIPTSDQQPLGGGNGFTALPANSRSRNSIVEQRSPEKKEFINLYPE